MKIRITNDFKHLCERIYAMERTEKDWAKDTGEDFLFSDSFEGRFDPNSNSFCFTYFAPNLNEYEFRINLNEIKEILDGKITHVEGKKV